MAINRKIKRQGLPETLAESLRERILNGEFREGDALIQDAIASEYDVSRMPVREALRQLEAWGLVVMQLHKGAVVSSIPTEQIAELYELRAMLECDLLERSIPRLTDAQLANSLAILGELDGSYKSRNFADWGRLNWEFHRSLYLAAERVQTLAVVQGINLQTARYVRLQLLLTRAFKDAEQEHRHLLKLCEQRDVAKAVSFLKDHILDSGRKLLVALRKSRTAAAA